MVTILEMIAKKPKVKKSSTANEFDNKIQLLSEKVNELKSSNNLEEIVSARLTIQSEIKDLQKELSELELKLPKKFVSSDSESTDSSNSNSSNDDTVVDPDFNFTECFESVQTINKKIWNGDLSLNDQIRKYTILDRKIKQCTQIRSLSL